MNETKSIEDTKAELVAAARVLARELMELAVGGVSGVRVYFPIYRLVTQGRDPGAWYSSCADLAHWLLWCLGVRCAFVNRAENGGFRSKATVNLLLAKPVGSGAEKCARLPTPRERFETGDIIIAWARPDAADAHVMVVDSFDGHVLRTWDYGQGPMKPEAWKGNQEHIEGRRRARRAYPLASGLWRLEDGKTVRSVLPLATVLEHAANTGKLVEAVRVEDIAA